MPEGPRSTPKGWVVAVTCEARTDHCGGASCMVDWSHNIHLGWSGKVRVRWTDDGEAHTPEALVAFEAECAERSKGGRVNP